MINHLVGVFPQEIPVQARWPRMSCDVRQPQSSIGYSLELLFIIVIHSVTRHNSIDSVPTLNLVCITEVAIKTVFCVAGIFYYTCNLLSDIQCTRCKMPSTNVFNELRVKISLLRSIPKNIYQHVMRFTSGYASI